MALKNTDFFQKNADIGKIKVVLVLKEVFVKIHLSVYLGAKPNQIKVKMNYFERFATNSLEIF